MAPHSPVVASLKRCLEVLKRVKVAAVASPNIGDPNFISYLSDLELNINYVLTNNNALMTRPVSCVCYKEHLKRGTASERCGACQSYGFNIDTSLEAKPALVEIERLSHNLIGWDGEEVKGARASTFRLAKEIADIFGKEVVVSLNSDGSLQFDKKVIPGVIGQITVQTVVDKTGT